MQRLVIIPFMPDPGLWRALTQDALPPQCGFAGQFAGGSGPIDLADGGLIYAPQGRKVPQSHHHSRRQKAGHYRERPLQKSLKMDRYNDLRDTAARAEIFSLWAPALQISAIKKY